MTDPFNLLVMPCPFGGFMVGWDCFWLHPRSVVAFLRTMKVPTGPAPSCPFQECQLGREGYAHEHKGDEVKP